MKTSRVQLLCVTGYIYPLFHWAITLQLVCGRHEVIIVSRCAIFTGVNPKIFNYSSGVPAEGVNKSRWTQSGSEPRHSTGSFEQWPRREETPLHNTHLGGHQQNVATQLGFWESKRKEMVSVKEKWKPTAIHHERKSSMTRFIRGRTHSSVTHAASHPVKWIKFP